MARRGQVIPEVQRLLNAARAQWGRDCVVESGVARFTIKPPRPAGERGQVIVVNGKGKARGCANAKAMLRQAGLKV